MDGKWRMRRLHPTRVRNSTILVWFVWSVTNINVYRILFCPLAAIYDTCHDWPRAFHTHTTKSNNRLNSTNRIRKLKLSRSIHAPPTYACDISNIQWIIYFLLILSIRNWAIYFDRYSLRIIIYAWMGHLNELIHLISGTLNRFSLSHLSRFFCSSSKSSSEKSNISRYSSLAIWNEIRAQFDTYTYTAINAPGPHAMKHRPAFVACIYITQQHSHSVWRMFGEIASSMPIAIQWASHCVARSLALATRTHIPLWLHMTIYIYI